MNFDNIWNSSDENCWNRLFQDYWSRVLPQNIQIEYRLNRLRKEDLECMDATGWYAFLHDQYFVWKYTAKNRLATTRAQLRKYTEGAALDVLDGIRQEILNIDVDDVGNAIATVCQIKGLGIAGASGLLSLIYPENYATVDQFVVKALLEVPEHRHAAEQMNPESLTLAEGVTLTEILRSKAAAMNDQFDSTFWNPRTLEMALWAYRGA